MTSTVWIYVAGCLGAAAFTAYTSVWQEATLYWGRVLSPSVSKTGIQDAITPEAQDTRNMINLALFAVVPAAGWYLLGWVAAIAGFVGWTISSSVFRLTVMPKPDSSFFLSGIVGALADKRLGYAKKNDVLRVQAVDDVLERIKSLDPL